MLKAVNLGNPIFDTISKRVRESYPNACILWIDEVQNPMLEERFEQLKKIIAQKRGRVEVRKMFHGTSTACVNQIIKNGFDPSFNKCAAYGCGTYFAEKARYSFNYMKVDKNEHSMMFLADVLVGNTTPGHGYTKLNTELYDNWTGPDMIVTPYPDGAYPRYVIAFHKNAK
jgi:hypothetical protein